MTTDEDRAPARSPVLPDGYSCAMGLTFDVDSESPILDIDPGAVVDASLMTHQAFGPRVGVPRILRMLAEESVRATFFVPGWTARRWPGLVDEILSEGHEVAHHSDLHHQPTRQTPEEQRRDFVNALETLRALGVEVAGHRAAYWQASWQSLELVGEHGLLYDSSLMDSDRPYLLRAGGGVFAELPPHFALDDWPQYAMVIEPDIGSNIESPGKLVDIWTREIKAQRGEGGLVVLTAHPFLSGRASRVDAIRQVIDEAKRAGDVWIAPLSEIAERTHKAGLAPREPDPPDLDLGPYERPA